MPKPTNFCAVRPSVAFGSTARRLPGWRADCPPGREIGFRPTTSGLRLETDIVRAGRHVSKVPILLQKSFWGDERKFSGTLTRVARGNVRDHVILEKKTTDLRSGLMALRHVAAN